MGNTPRIYDPVKQLTTDRVSLLLLWTRARNVPAMTIRVIHEAGVFIVNTN